MKTIAIWYEAKNNNNNNNNKKKTKKNNKNNKNNKNKENKTKGEDDIKLEIHINFWKLKIKDNKNEFDYFIDFGFMIDKIDNIKKLKIYFPIKDLKKTNFEDLGRKFDAKVTNSIFNESCIIKDDDSDEITVSKKEDDFVIYKIDINNETTFLYNYDGSIMSIDLNSLSGKYYLRFRFKGESVRLFKNEYEPTNSFFESHFIKIETIDFRINEKRNYPIKLIKAIKNEFNIKKVHFLLLRSEKEELVSSHLNYRCRILESNLWNKYINDGNKEYSLKDILSYHISKKSENEKIDSFNVFMKIKYRVSNKKTISLYLFYLFLFSIFSSVSASYLRDTCDNHCFSGKQDTNRKVEKLENKKMNKKNENNLKKEIKKVKKENLNKKDSFKKGIK